MRRFAAGISLLFFPFVVAPLLTRPAAAQPFDAWLLSTPGYPGSHGYVEIPNHAALNPTTAFTLEAWILVNDPDGVADDCRSITGKDLQQSWWLGVCNVGGVRTLRSYLKGVGTSDAGGRIAVGQWTHVAVTFDGATKRHYINGELVLALPSPGAMPASNAVARIGSDAFWERSPNGSIDEVRLWNVARTQAQIRDTINVRVTTALPGLVAVWPLSGNANDIIGPHDGVLMGSGVNYFIGAVAADCGAQTATALCLNHRFQATARYRVGPQTNAESQAMTIPCAGPLCLGSGIFWFFQNTNWELMVKSLNGCAITNRWWLFNAGLTNLYFRLEVTDVTKSETKIYFNYPGPPAPAITDIFAFATCP
jgi:hypothetical protein